MLSYWQLNFFLLCLKNRISLRDIHIQSSNFFLSLYFESFNRTRWSSILATTRRVKRGVTRCGDRNLGNMGDAGVGFIPNGF